MMGFEFDCTLVQYIPIILRMSLNELSDGHTQACEFI